MDLKPLEDHIAGQSHVGRRERERAGRRVYLELPAETGLITAEARRVRVGAPHTQVSAVGADAIRRTERVRQPNRTERWRTASVRYRAVESPYACKRLWIAVICLVSNLQSASGMDREIPASELRSVKRRRLIVAGVLLAGGVAGYFSLGAWLRPSVARRDLQLGKVETGAIESTLQAAGTSFGATIGAICAAVDCA